MSLDTSILRKWDIRGIYPEQINENVAKQVGFAYAKFLKETILPALLMELSILFVLENACISPWYLRFLSTHNVLSVLASNPVKNILATINKSISLFFILKETSL